MVKMSKFARSQAAHYRLKGFYANKKTKESAALCNYHAYCFESQIKRGKIIPKAERKLILSFWKRSAGV